MPVSIAVFDGIFPLIPEVIQLTRGDIIEVLPHAWARKGQDVVCPTCVCLEINDLHIIEARQMHTPLILDPTAEPSRRVKLARPATYWINIDALLPVGYGHMQVHTISRSQLLGARRDYRSLMNPEARE